MPPRRSARALESPSESPEPPFTRPKRRGGAGRETPPKKSRTTERFQSSELATPNLRSTRSTSQSTVVQTPKSADLAYKTRQTARRTGGAPLPRRAALTAPTSSRHGSPAGPRMGQPYVDIVVPRASQRRTTASEESDESSEEDATRTRRRARVAAAAAEEEGEDELEIIEIESDDSVGAAGPGPRTTRNRNKLQPVPQPSPSVFHRYLGKYQPQTSQAESIDDPDSSPQSSPPPETQLAKPRRRKMAVVDGIEMEIFLDDEPDEQTLPPPAPDEKHVCYWDSCGAEFKSSDELAKHIDTHADMYRKVSSEDAGSRRVSVAQSPSVRSSQSGEGSKTLDFLTRELEMSRSQAAEFKAELDKAKAKHDELSVNAKNAASLRAQILADARADFSKQLAEAQAGFEKKLQEGKDENESELGSLREELDSAREELDKRVEEVSELEAMVKATEVELMKRNTTIEELQAKLKSSTEDPEQAATGTEVTLPPDAPAEDRIRERDDIIASLRKELKRSKKTLKTTKSDLAFIREQYEVASSSAVQEVNRAKELDAEVAKLREQLMLGLKQRDLFNAASVDVAKKDAEQARHQVNLLLEQSRRTDDAIRRKAAQHHDLSKANQELEVDLHKERSRAHELSKRNDELSAQVSELRGRLMGAFDKVDESDDDEPAPAGYAMPTLVPDDNREAVIALDPTLAGDAPIWQCKWLVGDRLCGLYFDTREELDGHGQGVHICALEAN